MASTHAREISHLPPPWNIVFPIASRIFVWGLFFLTLYVLRSFFLLIFLTFVFSYIQMSGVEALAGVIKSRGLRVVLVGLVLLLVLVAVGAFLVPNVREQAQVFAGKYTDYITTIDREIERLSVTYPIFNELVPALETSTHSDNHTTLEGKNNDHHSPTTRILQELLGLGEPKAGQSNLKQTVETIRNIGGILIGVGSTFLLSLLFSFLIVLDFERLRHGVNSLADTKVAFIYNETAGSVAHFGRVLGRALQAQLAIALVNTILTAIGIYLLGLRGNLAFLSVVVFVCSFIPVAGVFISSLPICLLTLQEFGAGRMVFAALLIWIIHLIEAYILNPKIFGHHLRVNAVLVLIILTIGGKLFHIWGLVLGLPVCTYVFKYAIRRGEPEAR